PDVPGTAFFAQLGLFVVPRFFDAELCSRLRQEMRAAPSNAATIVDERHQLDVREEQRKCDEALVSAETRDWATARVLALKPSLEAHFDVRLNGCQPLSFLVYKPGCFFGRHVDNSHDPNTLPLVRDRIVSISIFLNGPGGADQADTYGGGTFALHGLRMG